MTPDEYTIGELTVDVGEGHRLYVQDWGNPSANEPILFLHGGPGLGTSNTHRQYFNPELQRVIFMDQRGAGKSLPYGELRHNTTADLIEDIEKVTTELKLKTFRLFGISWGSCLALAYTLKYPSRVTAILLRGIFTGSRLEIDYLDKGGYRTFFPDAWEQYLNQTPPEHRLDPTAYHFKRILGSNVTESRESAYIYASLERSLMALDDRYIPADVLAFDPIPIRTEVYYTVNNFFLEDRHILKNAGRLNIPIWLVQGRYDVVCPPATAFELHNTLADSTLFWTMAGHGNDRSSYDVVRTILSGWN